MRTAAAVTTRPRERRTDIAAVALCVGLGLMAMVVRFVVAWRIPGPWYVDEFVYGNSARVIAENKSYFLSHFGLYYYLYPRLIAPAWFFHSMSTTYAAVKLINAVLMTLAIVPFYLWARRLLPPAGQVGTVALVIALPTGLYVSALVTENAFFPAFALAAFAVAAMLERPTLRSQVFALAAIALACAVRLQGLVFALIVPSALAIKIALDVRSDTMPRTRMAVARELRKYALTLATGVLGALAYAMWKIATGGAASGGLGVYAAAVDVHHYSASQAFEWVLYHFGGLTIVVGFVPLAALILYVGAVWRREVDTTPSDRAFVAVAVSAVVWVVIEVGVFASRRAERISERYMFHVEPILLLALMVWIYRGAPRRRPALGLLIPLALVVTLPLEQLLANSGVLSETFGFLPLIRASQHLENTEELRLILGGLIFAAGLLVVLLPERVLLVGAPVAVFVYLALASAADVGPLRAYALGLRGSIGLAANPAWIDEAVPRDATVDVLYGGESDQYRATYQLLETQFWNRRFRVVDELTPLATCCAPYVPARIDPETGRIDFDPTIAPPEYIATIPELQLDAKVIKRSPEGVLYRRTKAPWRLRETVSGVYPDGWMGTDALYRRFARINERHARLAVRVSRDGWSGPSPPAPTSLEVVRGGRIVDRRGYVVRSGVGRTFVFSAPRPPFEVRVHVGSTFSPSQYGSGDARELGAQVSFQVGGS
jgi:hypothetical protein